MVMVLAVVLTIMASLYIVLGDGGRPIYYYYPTIYIYKLILDFREIVHFFTHGMFYFQYTTSLMMYLTKKLN